MKKTDKQKKALKKKKDAALAKVKKATDKYNKKYLAPAQKAVVDKVQDGAKYVGKHPILSAAIGLGAVFTTVFVTALTTAKITTFKVKHHKRKH